MPSRSLIAAVIGLAVVAVALSVVLMGTRKNRVELTGEILKVRTKAIDESNAIAILDFRLNNPSTQQFVVRTVELTLTGPDNQKHVANIASDVDARRLFDYYPVLGQKFNPSLVMRDRIESGQTLDRMLAVSFTAGEAAIVNRKGLRLTITDVDGGKSEIISGAPSS